MNQGRPTCTYLVATPNTKFDTRKAFETLTCLTVIRILAVFVKSRVVPLILPTASQAYPDEASMSRMIYRTNHCDQGTR